MNPQFLQMIMQLLSNPNTGQGRKLQQMMQAQGQGGPPQGTPPQMPPSPQGPQGPPGMPQMPPQVQPQMPANPQMPGQGGQPGQGLDSHQLQAMLQSLMSGQGQGQQ